ncbi:uncharacterized protein LOC143253681 isoform X2 [Tachypleus tridentatus]|uniref:uncharacterized protein LOC143253681 isoform X2 n=1 Tax=Tachypleus tridentatus TaxID=6853 RepID=UPI003FD52092
MSERVVSQSRQESHRRVMEMKKVTEKHLLCAVIFQLLTHLSRNDLPYVSAVGTSVGKLSSSLSVRLRCINPVQPRVTDDMTADRGVYFLYRCRFCERTYGYQMTKRRNSDYRTYHCYV